jgi:hypothetical protein
LRSSRGRLRPPGGARGVTGGVSIGSPRGVSRQGSTDIEGKGDGSRNRGQCEGLGDRGNPPEGRISLGAGTTGRPSAGRGTFRRANLHLARVEVHPYDGMTANLRNVEEIRRSGPWSCLSTGSFLIPGHFGIQPLPVAPIHHSFLPSSHPGSTRPTGAADSGRIEVAELTPKRRILSFRCQDAPLPSTL